MSLNPKITGTLQINQTIATGTLSADHVSYSTGTKNYEELKNKPALVYGDIRKELVGDVSMADFGLKEEALQGLENTDIDDLITTFRGLI